MDSLKFMVMKIVFIFLFALVSLKSSAQSTTENVKPYYYYLQMCPFAWVGGKEWRGEISLDNYDPYILCDANNERIAFSGPMQIFNYLIKLGWEFVSFESGNGGFFYIFRKLVTKDEDAKAGMNLLTSDEIKKAKKNR